MQHDAKETGYGLLVQAPLRQVTQYVSAHPVVALLLAGLLAVSSVGYAFAALGFKTHRSDLIDPNTEYHKRWLAYTESFGSATDLVVVVEGDRPDQIKDALDDLGAMMRQNRELFSSVFYRVDSGNLALRKKGLHYLSPAQLQELDDRLGEFGLVLKGNWKLFNLKSIYRGLTKNLGRANSVDPTGKAAEPVLEQLAILSDSLEHFSRTGEFRSPWQGLVELDPSMLEQADLVEYRITNSGRMGFLQARPTVTDDFGGASDSIERLRELMADVERRHQNVQIGLTGIPVLEYDEMRDSQQAMFKASTLSFAGVGLILFLGFRGFRHPALALAMLAVAMAWSIGAATITVGHLNILSVSFFAILIGLGIDFGIHYLARYLELRHGGHSLRPALLATTSSVGPGILTAGVTTALAFFCAGMTDFLGVAELGIIAGCGILLCAAAAFLVLPALVALADKNAGPRRLPVPFQARNLKRLIARHPVFVVTASLMLLGFLSVQGFKVKYDSNLLHLQARGLESVETQNRIFEESDHSLLFGVSLANSPQQALKLKQQFESLPTVDHVVELGSMMPLYPANDTTLLVQSIRARLSKLPARDVKLTKLVNDFADTDPESVGRRLEDVIEAVGNSKSASGTQTAASLDSFLDRMDGQPLNEQMKLLQEYQRAMTHDLLASFWALSDAADPNPVTIDDLPEALRTRFVSDDGKWLLQVYPSRQIWDMEPLEEFVNDVRKVDPEVTGTPLQNFEASRQIRESYEAVALYALIAVFLVLLLDFRNVWHAMLTLLPPLAGAAMMMGVLALLHVDLNPANLIVLPLVIGIGVDDGVHVMHDFRRREEGYRMSASTTNAILLTSLTTMIGFGSMMISAHRGLYSLGLVLVVGVGGCLFVSLVTLPATLTMLSGERTRKHPWRFTEEGRTWATENRPPIGK